MKRRSIEPTYDSRETGPRYHVTTFVGDRCIEFQKPLSDPFVHHRVFIRWRDLLRGLLYGRIIVAIQVGGDRDITEDVMELDADYLGPNCTRRDEFGVSLGASLRAFAATDPVEDRPAETGA